MPDPSALALLAAAALLAGLVRGFTGFGTAMVYLPVAGQLLDPFAAITSLVAMDLVGPLPLVPRALREADRPDVARLVVSAALVLPLGVLLLAAIDPDIFRLVVSLVALGLLAVLLTGWRVPGGVTPTRVCGAGAAGGFLGGVAGLPGPPVILLYMASDRPAAAIRANNLLFLVFADIALLLLYAGTGRLEFAAAATGLLMILPNMLGNLAGAAIFRPERARLYRGVAYLVIAASALAGLPLGG